LPLDGGIDIRDEKLLNVLNDKLYCNGIWTYCTQW